MITDVNENRFIMVEKKPEYLSNYTSPIKYSIKSKKKRFNDKIN